MLINNLSSNPKYIFPYIVHLGCLEVIHIALNLVSGLCVKRYKSLGYGPQMLKDFRPKYMVRYFSGPPDNSRYI